jgi:hypothetical protein
MARSVGSIVPACGLVLGVAALMLWAWATSVRRLDAIALAGFTLGLALSVVGYARGDTLRARRLAVVGMGCNALGFALVMLPYAGG